MRNYVTFAIPTLHYLFSFLKVVEKISGLRTFEYFCASFREKRLQNTSINSQF